VCIRKKETNLFDFFTFLFQWLRSCYGSNWGKVSETVYRSSEPNADKLAKWKQAYQLDAVLDLRDVEGGEEMHDVSALGMLYYHIRMKDDAEPSPDQVKEALYVLQSGVRVLVHCKGGRHRAGLICACYEVMNGKTKEAAWKNAEKFGWYDFLGHKPIRLWFENEFKPEDYK
jgi:protein-tyrosine phosphatase